jgi:hypothetical protein
MAEHGIAKLASVAGRIKSEMRYWSGYDAELLTDFTDEVEYIERWMKENDDSKRRHKREVAGGVFQFFIVCFCITAVILGIAFAVNLGGDKKQAAIQELKNDPQYRIESVLNGWQHSTIPMKTPGQSTDHELELYYKFK